MMGVFMLGVALITGVWVGFSTRPSARQFFIHLSIGLGYLAASLGFYSWQCNAATIPDILLFRDVPGQFFCSGGITVLGYMLFVSAAILGLRLVFEKPASKNAPRSDI